MTSKVKITRGSSNVFADLGFPDAETHQLKAQLVVRIQDVMKSKKLTQAKVAKLIGASQPDVSRMLRGHFHDISCLRAHSFER
jgi:predicted XRE-type DNA-binding protein